MIVYFILAQMGRGHRSKAIMGANACDRFTLHKEGLWVRELHIIIGNNKKNIFVRYKLGLASTLKYQPLTHENCADELKADSVTQSSKSRQHDMFLTGQAFSDTRGAAYM
jgi:hypothetical protein